MSIFDTFYTLFKSLGADKVKKDNEQVKKSNDSVDKSFKNVNEGADKVRLTFSKLEKEIFNMAAASFSAGAVIAGLKSSLDYATNIDQASRALGVNVSELDLWGNAVQRTGGTLQGFEASLGNLAEKLGTDGETALQILPQLADNLSKMPRNAALNYGRMLGLDEGTILLLRHGRAEIEALLEKQKQLGLVTKEQAESARKFSFAWQDATHSIREFFLALQDKTLPILTKLTNDFGLAANDSSKDAGIISTALVAQGGVAVVVFGSLGGGISVVLGLAAAFALLYGDIKKFSEGKDSVIGSIDAKHPFFKNIDDFAFKHHILPGFLNPNKNQSQQAGSQKSLTQAQQQIAFANSVPITYTSPAAQGALKTPVPASQVQAMERNLSITTGPITINTQATDANGVAQAFTKSLKAQLKQTIHNFDDGIQG